MKKILIFDVEVSGHHLEYLHHIYSLATQSKDTYIFCLPKEFNNVKSQFEWKKCDNIIFDLFDNYTSSHSSILNASYEKCKILKERVKTHSPTNVFLISLMHYLPFLTFILPHHVKVSGIIYQIYLYRWKTSNIIQRLSDVMKYILLSLANCVDKIYILNDKPASHLLNRIYHTKKFAYLPDPFIPIDNVDEEVTREILNIDQSKFVFLHMGDMRKRKGTIDILDSIPLINEKLYDKLCFIFAGKISNEIKEIFYQKVALLNPKVQIIVYDEFCEYSFLAALCHISDYMLIPYKFVNQSSGLIGYSAQFKLPVISPKEGLLGKLVKRYKLGYTIANINKFSIAEFINNVHAYKKFAISNKYLRENNVNNFLSSIHFN